MMRHVPTAALWFLLVSAAFAGAGSPTGWSPIILPTGTYRTQIKSMPIETRPGRPLHVYGNTIRLIDNVSHGRPVRPMRQIFFGTPQLRTERTQN